MQPSAFAAYKDLIPPHTVTEAKAPGGERSLVIGDWKVSSRTTHIMSAAQIDEAAQHLAIPLPEMTFASNHLSLSHAPSGLSFSFAALPSLAEVKDGEGWENGGGGVKVKHAEAWGKTRSTGPSPLMSDGPLPTKPVRPFDWTYTTLHAGLVAAPSSSSASPKWRPADPDQADECIPLELLSRPDPILFYDEVPLFESELDDNGSSVLSARVRVMPHSLFVLFRHFLRVDGVLFRIHDVRLFHLFGSSHIVRETAGWEASYDAVKACALPPPYSDPSLLSNPGWVHQVLSGGGGQGRRKPAGVKLEVDQKPWPGLGRRLEVLDLIQLTTAGNP